MEQRFTTGLAILLLTSFAFACSLQRPKQPLSWHVTLEIDGTVPDREAATRQSAKVLEARLDALGVSSFEVQAQGTPLNGRILVNLPDVPDRERLKKVLTAEARLELAHLVSPASPLPFQSYDSKQAAVASLGGAVPEDRRVSPYAERSEQTISGKTSEAGQEPQRWVVVEVPAIVGGSDLRNAVAVPSRPDGKDYQIAFSLTPEGAQKFGAWTGAHINNYIAVMLNGEVKSVAYIKSQITDRGEISGRFTKQSAEDLALVLRSGALPAPVKVVEEGENK